MVRVWLSDDVSQTAVVSGDSGYRFSDMTIWVMPQRVGTWRVNARFENRCGQANQTGAVRTVVIQ
jgi:hypothetical protein